MAGRGDVFWQRQRGERLERLEAALQELRQHAEGLEKASKGKLPSQIDQEKEQGTWFQATFHARKMRVPLAEVIICALETMQPELVGALKGELPSVSAGWLSFIVRGFTDDSVVKGQLREGLEPIVASLWISEVPGDSAPQSS